MINNLESPILILHQESQWNSQWNVNGMDSQWNVFYLQWKVFNFEKLLFEINTQINQNTVGKHRTEWKAIIITLIEMSGRKRLTRFKINKEKLRIK